MLSIIIPSRQPQFLQQTINDLLKNAEGEIEIIVVLDGYWPDTPLEDNSRVRIVHRGKHYGMREGINTGVALSKGEFIMKIDEHCMVDKGFDVKLVADCQEDWLVVPRRKRLDAEKWEILIDGRPDIDYMKIDYPFAIPFDSTQGLHGSEWKQPAKADILIDDLMSSQGSCWFMPRKLWDRVIGRMDSEKYGTFTMEAQELMNKVWLSGGRCVVNKKTWYAHYHKGKNGKGYNFNNKQYEEFMADKEKGRQYAIDYWLTTKDFKYDFAWLVQKFWPIPGWPEDWQERLEKDKLKDYRYAPDFGTWKAH